MKNLITTVTTVIAFSLLSTAVQANMSEPAHRVGVGYNSTNTSEWLTKSDKWGDGIRLEYGYELNEILGINLSYSQNKDTFLLAEHTTDLDGYNIKIDTDIGYKIHMNGFAIKPYGILGLARQSETRTLNSTKYRFNEISFVTGAGLRADLNQHLYSDFRFDFSRYDDNEYYTVSWTLGYLF
ncbi:MULTISPECIES: porin family protein [Vibrio]|uniref:Outer membrane protein beta-barrel domain-containing protein n=1 Tax=Vibrio halioticoli NBRC 102217 TaxID=1219072 RepID=V5FB57_9VIBR|nr:MULTISPECIES: porin family protein [Vibrio]MPW37230.1 outer membrane beta-barrel protein [Vibrio sp. B1Z05]GAD88433.1 hypothetical protein VHA01S_005_00350 [Vibrio halioticoli NBRC 102217]